jgi:hypothetical protein
LRAPRSRLIAAAAIIAAGTFALAAAAANGIESSRPSLIPESAFSPVTLPASSSAPLVVPGRASASSSAVIDEITILREPLPAATAPADRAQPSLPSSKPVVINVAPKVVDVAPKTTHVISGLASWYCRAGISPCTVNHPDDGGIDAYAAAGPRLRAAIGDGWRGKVIYVDGLRVKLIDWCQCYKGEPHEKLLDLYYDVFARVGSQVRIRW